MKKLMSILVAALLVFGTLGSFAACTPRENTLKILSWEEYIDESILKDFEEEYQKATGTKVKIRYDIGEDNETMLSIINGGADYDLICPSEYMVEKMINLNLLQKIDYSKIPNRANFDELFDETEMQVYDPDHQYSLPYLYGTLGIMYNPDDVASADVQSWEALWDAKYSGKISMKKNERDPMAVANIIRGWNDLDGLKTLFEQNGYDSNFRATLSSYINDSSSAAIEAARIKLTAQRPLVLMYETDADRIALTDGTGNLRLGLFWSCDAGVAMSENKKLEYVVPKEGSNLWVDSYAILKDAVNVDAAHAFLNYLCDVEVAAKNMDAAGACSPVAQAVIDLRAEYEADTEFFAGKSSAWKKMYLDTMFMGDNVADRCVVMRDFGSADDAIKDMWADVRLRAQ